jgi:elongation factor Ts
MEIDKKKLVQELRQKTGLAMNECLKLLKECDWNIESEEMKEKIKKIAETIASKKMDRDASQGGIMVKQVNNKIYYVKISCETDFVVLNATFVNLCENVLNELCLGKDNFETTAKELIKSAIAVIGEKMELGDYGVFNGNSYFLYTAMGATLGKKLAMISSDSSDAELNLSLCRNVLASAIYQSLPDNLTDFLNFSWYADENKKLSDILKENNANLKDFKYISI